MIDVDVGQQYIVDAYDTVPTQFTNQMGDGRQWSRVDEKGEAVPTVVPGADEFAETIECPEVEVDADEVVEVHALSLLSVECAGIVSPAVPLESSDCGAGKTALSTSHRQVTN
jgi:hypothetical protein